MLCFFIVCFPVVMYKCESWTIKKSEHWRIDAFKLWCWRRLLTWTAQRWNQSILKEISLLYSLKDCCWSWSFNTLATWCKTLIHWKRPWCWERLKARREGGDSGGDGWMASLAHWNMSLSKFSEIVKDREVWQAAVHGAPKSQTWCSDWTTINQ